MKALDKVIIFFLAAVFLWSGIDKILHYHGFLNALRDYVVLPTGTAIFLAIPVIACELVIGLGLLFRPWRRAACLSGAVLLSIFTAVLTLNHAFGGRGICGCWFTVTLARGTVSHIAQNLIMAALALSVWWSLKQEQTVPEAGATI
jgi:uncharacterized membrane protein YphA (DoxX/SURF4 family)